MREVCRNRFFLHNTDEWGELESCLDPWIPDNDGSSSVGILELVFLPDMRVSLGL